MDPISTPLELAADAESSKNFNPENTVAPVVVYSAESPTDGEMIRGLLESEGIPAMFTHDVSPVFGQIFSIMDGRIGDVLVSPEDSERAIELIAAYSRAEIEE